MELVYYAVRYVTPYPIQWCVDEPFVTRGEAEKAEKEIRAFGWEAGWMRLDKPLPLNI